jgi:hypothetical protein
MSVRVTTDATEVGVSPTSGQPHITTEAVEVGASPTSGKPHITTFAAEVGVITTSGVPRITTFAVEVWAAILTTITKTVGVDLVEQRCQIALPIADI